MNPTNSGNAGDNIVEAPATVHEMNKRGRVIKSDLTNLNGQVYIDVDNSPAPEARPSRAEGGDSHTNNTFRARL